MADTDAFSGPAQPLSEQGLNRVCSELGVKAAEVWTVVLVETDPPHGGFWANGKPQILYEQHIFHRLTNGRFDQSHPEISNPVAGNYGASGEHQYERLAEAMSCDRNAALMSASWGIGQTMGNLFGDLGYASPDEMVAKLTLSEDEQLLAMAREIKHSSIDKALANHDWKTFARRYNGAGYERNHYDEHLQSAYAKLTGGTLPDLHIRAVQAYLMYLGFSPRELDGVWGRFTCSAMNQFQRGEGLAESAGINDETFDRLVRRWTEKQSRPQHAAAVA